MRETGLFVEKGEVAFTYRVCAIIVKDGKLLMAKSKDYPCYYTVGGVVEINESSEEAVMREVLEETGYHLEIDKFFCVQERFFMVNNKKYHEINLFYLMKTNNNFSIDDNSCTDQPENETLHWLPINDLPKMNVVPESIKSFDFDNLSGIKHIISKEY
jgi:ADP-ribose pyrophosphatase YjhB (NUDIX family)